MGEQKRITMGQRVGYFFLALLPFILFIVIQLAASLFFMSVAVVQMMIPAIRTGHLSSQMIQGMQMRLETIAMDNLMEINVIYQIIGLAVFGIWYYFMVVYRNKVRTDKLLGAQGMIGIPLLGVGIEIVISFLLSIVTVVFPSVMEEYTKLLEEAGLNTITPVILFSTVILAPLVEELVFRGVVLYYAQKMTKHFWIANVFQALLFGIGHMNLVQGAYAFVLGMIMGCIYYKYRSVKATILMHAGFNLVGTVVSEIAEYALAKDDTVMVLSMEVILVLAGIIGLTLVLTDHKKKPLYS